MDLKEIYSPILKDLSLVEAEIKGQLSLLTNGHNYVNEIVNFFFDNPGQKLRPALVILSAKAAIEAEKSAGREQRFPEEVILLGAIVEYIHGASLVHDDVVDESDTRRGRPSLHIEYGNKVAVLAGDMLYSHAFSLLTDRFDKNVMKILSRCVQRMCRGEINELRESDFAGYLGILEDKTAIFMSACCHAGASIGTRNENSAPAVALRDFGLNLGMVYQIVDDLTDGDAPLAGTDFKEKLVAKLNGFVASAGENLSRVSRSVYRDSLAGLLKYMIEKNETVKNLIDNAHRDELAHPMHIGG